MEQYRSTLLGEISVAQNGARAPGDALQEALSRLDKNDLQHAIMLAANLLVKG